MATLLDLRTSRIPTALLLLHLLNGSHLETAPPVASQSFASPHFSLSKTPSGSASPTRVSDTQQKEASYR